jgi:hypothetical protein
MNDTLRQIKKTGMPKEEQQEENKTLAVQSPKKGRKGKK